MNLLVTGGAGFIGSNFIRHMRETHPDYLIVNLDKLTYAGNLDNLTDLENDENYRFVKGDICNEALVRHLLRTYSINAIINFAAESHVDRSISDPGIFVTTNISGTQVLLEAARTYGIDKYIQISTDEVYGSLGATGYFTEETPLAPNSPYSASKAAGDLLVRAYHETYGMNVNITRCSNNYGPFHFPEKLIPLMITHALDGKELPVYGDGLNIRDWLHVRDHAAAIDLVLHQGKSGEVYNIGGHNERTNIQIVELILERLGNSKALIRYVEDRLGHDRRYAIDPAKLESQLGWQPKYTFETGIVETIDWYLENEVWWRDIQSGQYLNGYDFRYSEPANG
ncbi:dTDP-glucose 4,6-dehydratase [Paenibacillus pasadenensis]|uniref:dTDP-glucose 4,6-dehydratase n=1 Tax=Paenibacillus pasadenensis TaxID=217090 RepID=UPI00203C668B|nr:dTDP-glucose 4,6-dehydratase [Paenibacillus pasadenensis]MCM3749148.1 dTDP-glucose 4,6-dehydratase [Paenibacillus pasadenensis]